MFRSLLYVPAQQQKFLARAHERGADALILDLEDSVPEADKEAARTGLAQSVRSAGQGGARVFVRVNSGPRQQVDIEAAEHAGAYGLVVPKAEPTTLPFTALPILALIESAAAVLDARLVARAANVIGLALGGEDLATALGATPTPDVLRFPKLSVHFAAKAEGKLSFGLLQSIADYSDLAALEAAAATARAHGFDGATCVHPSAVPILNAAFAPSATELAWARRVVEAAASGGGAFVLDGRMVDAPVIARARALLGR